MTPTIHISSTNLSPVPFTIYFSEAPQDLKKIFEMKAKQHDFTGKKDEILHVETVTDKSVEHNCVIGIDKKSLTKESEIRSQVVSAIQLARRMKVESVCIYLGEEQRFIQHIVEGVILGDYSFDVFKGAEKTKKNPHIKTVTLVGTPSTEHTSLIQKGINAAKAALLTRDLVNMPASHVFPQTLADHALEIAKKSNGRVTAEVLNEKKCNELGMGSFLCVGKGSDKHSVFIVLHYKGTGTKKYAFVGKSITFDSGGLSLKPGEHMMDMKIDMAGGATVLGVFDYLASEKPDISAFSDIYGVLPAAENMISGGSTKPGDVVTAMNGKTIEVLNTDAEGRLVLADALVYADTVLKADYITDIATLTGACAVALGNDLAGVFTDDDTFEKEFGAAAKKAGDEYWRMPLHAAYLAQMKSSIADLKNIGGGRYGGAITAAIFLKEFVKTAKWMHIDIAGPAHSDKHGASGWGVLSVIYFIESVKNI